MNFISIIWHLRHNRRNQIFLNYFLKYDTTCYPYFFHLKNAISSNFDSSLFDQLKFLVVGMSKSHKILFDRKLAHDVKRFVIPEQIHTAHCQKDRHHMVILLRTQ